jgi:hypothetical protein
MLQKRWWNFLIALVGVPLALIAIGYVQDPLFLKAPAFVTLVLLGLIAPGCLLVVGVTALLSAVPTDAGWRMPVALMYGVAIYTLCMSIAANPALGVHVWTTVPIR